ncbi:unnamed protein product, partial [Lepidochelys kempii]
GVYNEVVSLLAHTDDQDKGKIALRIAFIAEPKLAIVLRVLLEKLQKDEQSRVDIYCALEKVLQQDTQGLERRLLEKIITLASNHMRETQEATNELKVAASNTLVTLARCYFNDVMCELLYRLELPEEFIFITLGNLSSAYALECIPFVGMILNVMISMLELVKDSRMRQAFCGVLEKCSRAVNGYFTNWGKCPFPRMGESQFCNTILPLYCHVTSNWPNCEELELKQAIIKALGPMMSLLLHKKEPQNPIFKEISWLLEQYKEEMDVFHVTKDRCGFQLGVCDRHLNNTAWHQGLSNPMPEVQLTLEETALPPESTTTGRKRRRRSVPNQPVTWGTRLLRLWVGSEALPPLRARMTYNIWERLASIANVTHFSLSNSVAAGDLLGTCLIPVCHHPEEMENKTLFSAYANLSSQYSSMANWGPANYTLPRTAISLHTPYPAGAHNVTCARVVNCTSTKVPLGCRKISQPLLNCSHAVNVSYNYGHIILPSGWFFICGSRTFNYIPANLSDGTLCCLSRMTLMLPFAGQNRSKRSVPLSDDCIADVELFSRAEYTALAASIVGVPALAMYSARTLNNLACFAAKAINTTSQAIALLNTEQHELRDAILDNRAAIDFLLLKHHLGFSTFQHMCCFNLTDNSRSIETRLAELASLTTHIRQDLGFEGFWNWLIGWLPSLE